MNFSKALQGIPTTWDYDSVKTANDLFPYKNLRVVFADSFAKDISGELLVDILKSK
jgi:hypothetical protein